jgi:hypothetical protein
MGALLARLQLNALSLHKATSDTDISIGTTRPSTAASARTA